MKVLITGSEGFVGKHLVHYLKKRKFDILTFDITNNQDLLDTKLLKKNFKKNIDIIIHLAAYGDVFRVNSDPTGALIAGPAATMNLIKVANEFSVKKIIYASTWEVYGKPNYSPIDENHPCLPVHPYSIAKYSGELLIKSVMNKVPWIILRLGTVYGREMRHYAVIPKFITSAIENKPVKLEGKGNQKRQFIHIQDVCEAFLSTIKTKYNNEVFNIVANETVSIKQVAQIINKKLGLKTINVSKRVGDPYSSVISNRKAKLKLGWNPKTNLVSGITDLISVLQSKR